MRGELCLWQSVCVRARTRASDGVNACVCLTEGESLEEREKVEERRREGREQESESMEG